MSINDKRNESEKINKELDTYNKNIIFYVDEDNLDMYFVIDNYDGRTIKYCTLEEIITFCKTFDRDKYEKEMQKNIKAYAEMLTAK